MITHLSTRRDLYQPKLTGSTRRSTPILPGIWVGGGIVPWRTLMFTPVPDLGISVSGIKGSGVGDTSLKHSSSINSSTSLVMVND